MKRFLVCMSAVVLFSAHAFADDLEYDCSTQLDPQSSEGLEIRTFPYLSVDLTFRSCSTTSGGASYCSGGSHDRVADDNKVCYRSVDVESGCQISALAEGFTVTCKNGDELKLDIDSNAVGVMTCARNGVVRKTWKVGTCSVK